MIEDIYFHFCFCLLQPDRQDELMRIEREGGRVINWNGARVFGVLAMSRAIGSPLSLHLYFISNFLFSIYQNFFNHMCSRHRVICAFINIIMHMGIQSILLFCDLITEERMLGSKLYFGKTRIENKLWIASWCFAGAQKCISYNCNRIMYIKHLEVLI